MGRRFDPSRVSYAHGVAPEDGYEFHRGVAMRRGPRFVEWRLDSGGAISRLVVDSQEERHLQQYGSAGGDDSAFVAEFQAEPRRDNPSHASSTRPAAKSSIASPACYGLFRPTTGTSLSRSARTARSDATTSLDANRSVRRIDPGREFRRRMGRRRPGRRHMAQQMTGHRRLQAFDLDTGQPVADRRRRRRQGYQICERGDRRRSSSTRMA